MVIAMWRPGRRLFSAAAVLMILTAVAHTAGNLTSRPETAAEQSVFAAMNGYHVPLGLGMNPSIYDIYWILVMTMSITFVALGWINLLLAASPDISGRVLRRVSWANAVWVGAFLILAWVYRAPPALIPAAIIEVVVIGSLLGRAPVDA
jgi:hypothetical protein